jgi:hypothetical protein
VAFTHSVTHGEWMELYMEKMEVEVKPATGSDLKQQKEENKEETKEQLDEKEKNLSDSEVIVGKRIGIRKDSDGNDINEIDEIRNAQGHGQGQGQGQGKGQAQTVKKNEGKGNTDKPKKGWQWLLFFNHQIKLQQQQQQSLSLQVIAMIRLTLNR